MAKTQSDGAPTDPSDLDRRIAELTGQVKERFAALKQEVSSGQREMEKLSGQHERLTGKSLLGDLISPRQGRGSSGSSGSEAPKTRGRGRRKGTRKPSPTVEWLQETLGKKGMTVKQLQEAANDADLSGLKIAVMLKEHKNKFKSEAGTKEEGKKGKAAAVWGVR